MELRPRNLLLGGAVVLGGALCGLYFYSKSKAVKEAQPISKELMLHIFQEQERDSYRLLKFISQVFKGAFHEQKQLNLDISLEETKMIMFEQCREFYQCFDLFKIDQIFERLDGLLKDILDKYGIDEKEFLDALEVTFKDDLDIQKMRKPLAENLEKACLGYIPKFDCSFPAFLTAEKTLQIREKFLRKEEEMIMTILEPLKKEGRSFWENPEKVSHFLTSATAALELTTEKRKILVDEGLDDFKDAPEKIYDAALFEYLMTQAEFRQKIDDLDLGKVSLVEEFHKIRLQCT